MISVNEYLISKQNKGKIVNPSKITGKKISDINFSVHKMINDNVDGKYLVPKYVKLLQRFGLTGEDPEDLIFNYTYNFDNTYFKINTSPKAKKIFMDFGKAGIRYNHFKTLTLKEVEKCLVSKPIGMKKDDLNEVLAFIADYINYIFTSLLAG